MKYLKSNVLFFFTFLIFFSCTEKTQNKNIPLVNKNIRVEWLEADYFVSIDSSASNEVRCGDRYVIKIVNQTDTGFQITTCGEKGISAEIRLNNGTKLAIDAPTAYHFYFPPRDSVNIELFSHRFYGYNYLSATEFENDVMEIANSSCIDIMLGGKKYEGKKSEFYLSIGTVYSPPVIKYYEDKDKIIDD